VLKGQLWVNHGETGPQDSAQIFVASCAIWILARWCEWWCCIHVSSTSVGSSQNPIPRLELSGLCKCCISITNNWLHNVSFVKYWWIIKGTCGFHKSSIGFYCMCFAFTGFQFHSAPK